MTTVTQRLLFLSIISSFFLTMKPTKTKIDYGKDYVGAVEDPMDLVIAAALRATGDEYNRRYGKKDMPTERIKISDAGAGMRVFSPAGENTIAISFELRWVKGFNDCGAIDILTRKSKKAPRTRISGRSARALSEAKTFAQDVMGFDVQSTTHDKRKAT
jgi:hypothetical protein